MVTVRCWNLFQFKCANGWFPLWPSNFKIKCQKIMVALVILACWLVQKCNTSKMQHMLLTQGHRLLYCNFGENLIIQIDACGTKVAIVLGQFCMHCMKAWLFLLCDTATPPLLIHTQTQTQTHPMVVLKSKTWWWHANRLGFYVHCNITKWYMEQCHWKTLQLNAPGGHNNFVWSKIQIFKFPGWWDGLLHYFARTCLLRYSENSPAVFQPVEVQGNVINMEQGGLPKDETQMEFCCWMKQTIKTHNTQHTTHNTQHITKDLIGKPNQSNNKPHGNKEGLAASLDIETCPHWHLSDHSFWCRALNSVVIKSAWASMHMIREQSEREIFCSQSDSCWLFSSKELKSSLKLIIVIYLKHPHVVNRHVCLVRMDRHTLPTG